MNFSGAPVNETSLSKCDPSDELATADLVTKAKYLKLKRRFSALKEEYMKTLSNWEESNSRVNQLQKERKFLRQKIDCFLQSTSFKNKVSDQDLTAMLLAQSSSQVSHQRQQQLQQIQQQQQQQLQTQKQTQFLQQQQSQLSKQQTAIQQQLTTQNQAIQAQQQVQAKLEQIVKTLGHPGSGGQVGGATTNKGHKNKDPSAKQLLQKQTESDGRKKMLLENGTLPADCVVPTQSPGSGAAMSLNALAQNQNIDLGLNGAAGQQQSSVLFSTDELNLVELRGQAGQNHLQEASLPTQNGFTLEKAAQSLLGSNLANLQGIEQLNPADQQLVQSQLMGDTSSEHFQQLQNQHIMKLQMATNQRIPASGANKRSKNSTQQVNGFADGKKQQNQHVNVQISQEVPFPQASKNGKAGQVGIQGCKQSDNGQIFVETMVTNQKPQNASGKPAKRKKAEKQQQLQLRLQQEQLKQQLMERQLQLAYQNQQQTEVQNADVMSEVWQQQQSANFQMPITTHFNAMHAHHQQQSSTSNGQADIANFPSTTIEIQAQGHMQQPQFPQQQIDSRFGATAQQNGHKSQDFGSAGSSKQTVGTDHVDPSESGSLVQAEHVNGFIKIQNNNLLTEIANSAQSASFQNPHASQHQVMANSTQDHQATHSLVNASNAFVPQQAYNN